MWKSPKFAPSSHEETRKTMAHLHSGLETLPLHHSSDSLQCLLFPTHMVNVSLKTTGVFPGGPVDKKLPANAGDMGLIPGWGGSHMLRTN